MLQISSLMASHNSVGSIVMSLQKVYSGARESVNE